VGVDERSEGRSFVMNQSCYPLPSQPVHGHVHSLPLPMIFYSSRLITSPMPWLEDVIDAMSGSSGLTITHSNQLRAETESHTSVERYLPCCTAYVIECIHLIFNLGKLYRESELHSELNDLGLEACWAHPRWYAQTLPTTTCAYPR